MEMCLNVIVRVYKDEGYHVGPEIYINGWCNLLALQQSIRRNGDIIIEEACASGMLITGDAVLVMLSVKNNVVIDVKPIGIDVPGDAVKDIIESAICNMFNITPEEIRKRSNKPEYVTPRQLYYMSCFILAKRRKKQIARDIGFNHATVLHGIKKIGELYETNDPPVKQSIDSLSKIFGVNIYEKYSESRKD